MNVRNGSFAVVQFISPKPDRRLSEQIAGIGPVYDRQGWLADIVRQACLGQIAHQRRHPTQGELMAEEARPCAVCSGVVLRAWWRRSEGPGGDTDNNFGQVGYGDLARLRQVPDLPRQRHAG